MDHNTSRYERKNPYAKTAEIIQMALHDKDKEKSFEKASTICRERMD